jgi:recombination protein RecT
VAPKQPKVSVDAALAVAQHRDPHGQTLYDLLAAQRPAVAALIGRVLDPDRLLATMAWAVSHTPGLANCTPESLIGALHFCAQVGLMPGPQQHVYLIPYWNGQKKVYEAQPIIGYRGFWHLARRAGYIRAGAADLIWPQDHYRIRRGTVPVLEHEPAYVSRQGDPILAYSVVWLADGTTDFEPMPWADILAIRDRVLKRKRSTEPGPWETDLYEMAKKTVVRRHAKRWDLTPEAAWAIAVDEAREIGDAEAERRLTAMSAALWSPPASAAVAPPVDPSPPDAENGSSPSAPEAVPAPGPAKTKAPPAEEVAFTHAWAAAKEVAEEADCIAAVRAAVGTKKRAEWTPADWQAATDALRGLAATGAPF